MSSLNNVMLITGASSGFGRLAAKMAAERGYRVVVTARRAEKLDALVREIEAAGGSALAVPGDITDEAHQQRLLHATIEHYGRLDVLVNNACIPLKQGFVDSSLDDLRLQWHTNVLSIVTLTKRALQALIQSQGVVINIGSGVDRFVLPFWGMYFPTKVSVASISDALRRELRPYGVRVALVEPGPFNTEFSEKAGGENGGGLPPELVAQTIVRLAEHPKRLAVVAAPAAGDRRRNRQPAAGCSGLDFLGDHQAADAAAGRTTQCSGDRRAVVSNVPTRYIASAQHPRWNSAHTAPAAEAAG